MAKQPLPKHIEMYFWGDNIADLDIEKHKQYITQTILDRGDVRAIKWLFSTIDKESIKNTLSSLKLTKKSNNFWKVYLS